MLVCSEWIDFFETMFVYLIKDEILYSHNG